MRLRQQLVPFAAQWLRVWLTCLVLGLAVPATSPTLVADSIALSSDWAGEACESPARERAEAAAPVLAPHAAACPRATAERPPACSGARAVSATLYLRHCALLL
jgi:hypothetical protein